MHKSTSRHFQWKGCIETLEDRRVMSADTPLGGSIVHHYFEDEEAPPLEHHLLAGPDFWLNTDDLISIEDQLNEIEQTLSSAHNTTGLNSVVANYGFTGIGQTVAVIDSGIAYDHFALGGGFGANYRVVGGWDFTGENDANPYDDGPEGSHGTHVAGIVGGSAGADKGVAPGVDLVALRVFDDVGAGYFSWVENALQWVHQNRNSFENPITAINLSLGVASWNSNTIPSWSTLEDEFAQLEADGIFIAVSAGNAFASFNTPGLSYPAASPYVVPVMSVTDGGALANYSQRDTRAIAAPGSAIRSTVPDYRGNNNGIADDYANFSGTSMASPYIAGASVLIRQAMSFVGQTNITQDMIYNHMMNTATSFVDSVTGLTFKRLNLGAAINALMPTDDYGSTVATAHNFGSIGSGQSVSGVISTLTDIDYFSFTASTNGRVTFAVSDTTHNMDAAWSLSNGTGTLSNNGDTFAFDVVAGQTYTVGLSSTGGLGYYDLDVTSENTFTYTDWGTVSYSQLSGLANSGETWYRVQASRNGYLTVESMFNAQSGQINLGLYNSSMQLVSSGNPSNGTSRVDAYAAAGQQFFVRALGTNASINYRLSNLVSLSGTTVNVAGTVGNDTFTLTAGNTHTLTVKGITHSFNSVSVSGFSFAGGAGTDSITYTGTSGNETATFNFGQLNVTGTGHTVQATSVETITANGGGGNDQANLYDGITDDIFVGHSASSVLRSSDGQFINTASGFASVMTYATAGGLDRAWMYDGASDDVFIGRHDYAVLRSADGQFSKYASGFDSVMAYSTSGGNDRAWMYDSAGDDVLVARPESAFIRSATGQYYNYAGGFDTTFAYSTNGGNDVAWLYDGAGDDVFVSRPESSFMRAAGNGYYNLAEGFDRVMAYATTGVDNAWLYDSAGNDIFISRPTSSFLRSSNNSFYNYAEGFDRTMAYATAGTDNAWLYDSAGDDVYVSRPGSSFLRGASNEFYNFASGFDSVLAYATAGGNDRAWMYDSAGNDVFSARADHVRMSGSGYINFAYGFDTSYGYASTGNDLADLYDSVGNDTVTCSDWGVSIDWDALGRSEVRGFDQVTAYSLLGGTDLVDADIYDYLFSQIGGWQ